VRGLVTLISRRGEVHVDAIGDDPIRRDKSRGHRDRVNGKVMKDKRLAGSMDPNAMPFDVKRMIYGGFKVLVDL
jgi:hypothetical protein